MPRGTAGQESSAPLPSFEEQLIEERDNPENRVLINPKARGVRWTRDETDGAVERRRRGRCPG